MDPAACEKIYLAKPWMPRLLRPEVGAAMLARQRSGQINILGLQRVVTDDREEESLISAASTSAGGVAAIVGGPHTLAEQWILFNMEVELDTGADGEQRAPAILTVREGDVPAEIAAVFDIESLGLWCCDKNPLLCHRTSKCSRE